MSSQFGSKRAVVLHSGGQDSTTCVLWARAQGFDVECLSFHYGQRHRVELELAEKLCAQWKLPWRLVDLDFLSGLSNNALTSSQVQVSATGGLHNLPSTFVPGRNALFFTVAAAYAVPKGIHTLIAGVCEADYSGYPDCREDFVQSMQQSLSLAMDVKLEILTPLMHLNKAQTWKLAADLGGLDVVREYSHTCYLGERGKLWKWGYGCGTCPACELRRNGFEAFERDTQALNSNQ